MNNEMKAVSRSRMSGAKNMFAALGLIKAAGGQMAGREVIAKIRETVELTDWERENLIKTGNV